MINLSTKNIKGIISLLSFFLFSLFLPQKVSAVEYNCYYVTGKTSSKCVDLGGGYEFSIGYYRCNGQGGCSTGSTAYNVGCTFAGYGSDGGHRCIQNPNPPSGYTSYGCNNACKCTGGAPTKHCKSYVRCNRKELICEDDSGACQTNADCPCAEWQYGTTPVVCPGAGSGSSIGAGICCSGTGSGNGCTPTCPTTQCTVTDAMCAAANGGDTGYKAASTGDCKGNDASCFQDNGCGGQNTCNTSDCYKDEPNTTPDPPQDLQITIDGVNSGNLSTVSSPSPTLIKYPYPSSTTSTSIRNVTSAPAGSRAFGWELRIGSTLITPRKVFDTTPPFNVYGPYPSLSSLFQGYNGEYHARYYTRNTCNDDEKYSTFLDGYFRVNTLPVVRSTIIAGEANPEYKGCVPELEYTGRHVNRTLTVTVSGTDADDTNSINGAILWLVKDGSNITDEKELMTYVGPGDARVDMNKIGLFINSGGTVYISNNSGGTLTGWGRNGRDGGTNPHPVETVRDGNYVRIIDDVQLVEQKRNLLTGRYEYKITLAFPESSPFTGHYTLYTGMTDTLSYVQNSLGRTIDQRGVSSTGPGWNFDFENPTITNTDRDIDNDTRILDLTWNSNDVGSGIRPGYTIVNAYKNELPRNNVAWVNVNPIQSITPSGTPGADQVGNYNVASGWIFPSSGENNLMKISTGENSNGTLNLYITAYDKACNVGQNGDDGSDPPLEINLNKWVSTKGGVFYSKGTIDYATKEIENELYNLGTELISSTSDSIEVVLPYAPPNLYVNPAVAKRILNINNNSGLYTRLKENFDKKKESIPSATVNGGTVTCSSETGCIWEIPSPASTIGNTSYSGKIIAYSNSDITIEGEIKNDGPDANTNKDGLIIFSEGTITITGDTKTQSGTLETDIMDAWLLAKNNVIIAPGTGVHSGPPHHYHDQVYVTGGIVAFGEGASTPAFQLKRTLGLFNINNPVLKVDYHPKYSSLSEVFFGLHNPAYKREVGFKPM